jgi:hypothetical protein
MRLIDIVGVIIILAALSAWVTGVRMRRRIQKTLGRRAVESDLSSIKTWIEVDKLELHTGMKKTPYDLEPSLQEAEELVAEAEKAQTGLGGVPTLTSHRYPVAGMEVVPRIFGAGKLGYALMVIVPFLIVWWVSPTGLIDAPWFRWVLLPYAAATVWFAAYLGKLKLEIRTDGISYGSMFHEVSFVRFSDISSVMLLDDPHPTRYFSYLPASPVRNMVITPNPATGAPTLKIPLLFFPWSAREQLIRILRPEELDIGQR